MAEESFAAGLVGVVLDERYRLDAVIGEGGMGAVFRATHLAMDRRVAVKLLKPHLTADQTQLQRFAREARSTLKVDSPHAVKVLDFGVTPHRDYYMVLEYLDGRSVQRELDIDGPFAPARVIHVARQALQALGAAHERGLVHRDIKPDNLLLRRVGDDPDFAVVLDFGVAKLMEGTARSQQSALALTQHGVVFGTPEFMSPEQACGLPLDGRSDLYALAATMFVMLTGRGLFTGDSPLAWLTHHARTPPPRLADAAPALADHRALDALLQRCLAKSRDDRPATAADMAALLAAIAVDPTAPAAQPPAATQAIAALPARHSSSPSGYVEALAPDAPPPLAPLAPLSQQTRALPAARRLRGAWLAVGALAIVGVVGAALAVAVTRQRAPSSRPALASRVADAAPAPARPDAAVAVIEAVAQVVHEPDTEPTRAPPPAATPRPPRRPARSSPAEAFLRNAEDARRAGNALRQLAEADQAVRADPRSARARVLFGDALIKTGSKDRGCQYLRALTRNPPAIAAARAAGCPAD